METESIVEGLEKVLANRTGSRLNHLQRLILQKVWQGLKYREIAEDSGYTEGHIKDVGSDLWKLLSKVFDSKITKNNCKAVVKRYLQSAGLYKPGQFVAPLGDRSFPQTTPEIAPLIWSDLAGNDAPATIPPRNVNANLNVNVNFLGRSDAILQLQQLFTQGHRVIVIQGEGGLGKTTLAQHYLHNQGCEIVLELLMAKETQHITPADRIVEEWLRQDFGVEPGLEFGVSLGRLKRQLESRRVGILMDNLEPALDAQGRFLPQHRRYLELLRVLSDTRVQSITLITSRDRLCEADANLVHYRLPGLSLETWRDCFDRRNLTLGSDSLSHMHRAYGGNAKAMGILLGVIGADFDQDIAAYWQHHQTALLAEPDLHHLVLNQMARLQQLDPWAYRLFCRLGCYRYQDVPTISGAGVRAMLWDVAEPEQQRRIIHSLQHRSLIEFRKGEYWLHPMLREAAIVALQSSQEWDLSNLHAAQFWSDSVTTILTKQDALSALEAYHHYVAIDDFENAATVILKSRNNQWKQYLPLGSSLYRMGFVAPVLSAIDRILPRLTSDQSLGELYNILGDLRWISGQVGAAIDCQQRTIALATQALPKLTPDDRHACYYFRMLEVDATLSLGLYQVDLWELETAADRFRQVIVKAENTAHERWAERATVCLAWVLSHQGDREVARQMADRIERSLLARQDQTGSLAYFLQILGQTYVNLEQYDKAQILYHQALQSAVAGEYPQIKARSLNGLAQLDRAYQNLEGAVTSHRAAIALLESIGAKCDLAEAYFQLGITYQQFDCNQQLVIGQSEKAMQLFTEINAPQQLERIRQTLAIDHHNCDRLGFHHD